MNGLSGFEAAAAQGCITFEQAEQLSAASLQGLLAIAVENHGSDVSLGDIEWLYHHPNATQADIDAYVASTFESGQRKPKDGMF